MALKILNLTLSKKPFEVMVSGEKGVEFRKNSEWIRSRLFNKDGSRKEYDAVKFVNGYGKNKPYFIAEFNGFDEKKDLYVNFYTYSNGLRVEVTKGDFMIFLGEIIKKGNLN